MTTVTVKIVSQLTGDTDFLQLRGQYTVVGRAGGRDIDVRAAGAAETFRR